MTRDEWCERIIADLESILLHGYTTENRDPSVLHRKMCNDVQRLRDRIVLGWAQAQPEYAQPKQIPPAAARVQPAQTKTPAPVHANGAAQPPRIKT